MLNWFVVHKSYLKRSIMSESGQALVLVLLSLSVVLTIVLFVLSRSVTDISNSTSQSDSVRAFSAAEAGIENALITGSGTSGTVTIGDASYSVDVANSSAGQTTFNNPTPLLSGETMIIWFVSHKSDGTLTCDSAYPSCYTGDLLEVCWGAQGTSSSTVSTPAIEVSIYYESTPGDLSTVKIARVALDPNVSRRSQNSFSAASANICSINGVNYAFQNTISFSSLGGVNNNGLLFAKARMLYNAQQPHPIGVSVATSGYTLPSQGLEITSTGVSGTAGGLSNQSNRRINVFQGWPEFPFSGTSIQTPYGISK